MVQLKKQSGLEVIKILTKHFGFSARSTKGSHVVLIKFVNNEKIGTVVPRHKELKIGTLKGILEQAKVSEDEFAQYQ